MISMSAYNRVLLMYVAYGTGSGESTRYVVTSMSPRHSALISPCSTSELFELSKTIVEPIRPPHFEMERL